jgi:hypothetical protein
MKLVRRILDWLRPDDRSREIARQRIAHDFALDRKNRALAEMHRLEHVARRAR